MLCGIYIHPNTPRVHIEEFLNHLATKLSTTGYSDVPTIITGDFNLDVQKESWIIDFMRHTFDSELAKNSSPTTLGNTKIDLTFIKGVEGTSMPYVSYFSYHRPLFNRLRIPDVAETIPDETPV